MRQYSEANRRLIATAIRRQAGRCAVCGEAFPGRVRAERERHTRTVRAVCAPSCGEPALRSLGPAELEQAIADLANRAPRLVGFGPRPDPAPRGRGRPRRMPLSRYAMIRPRALEALGRDASARAIAAYLEPLGLHARTVERWEAEIRRAQARQAIPESTRDGSNRL